jgi:enoyl-[acyl-carrier protein] reductase II
LENRVTQLLGVDIPIFQAPMGFVAKPPLVAAVSEAGAVGLVPGSLGTDMVRDDIRRTRELTSKPFGVNLPLAFLRDSGTGTRPPPTPPRRSARGR